jgi:hypothetical protein
MGCPRHATSGLEKFEGSDRAYWFMNRCAVVHTGMLTCFIIVKRHSYVGGGALTCSCARLSWNMEV